MAISDKTYNKILLNTKSCSDIVNKLDLPSSFWESFHFRPTSSGVTIVSTLSYAPIMQATGMVNDHAADCFLCQKM